MGHVTNGTHSSQMEIPNGNFPVFFFVNGKRPIVSLLAEIGLFTLMQIPKLTCCILTFAIM